MSQNAHFSLVSVGRKLLKRFSSFWKSSVPFFSWTTFVLVWYQKNEWIAWSIFNDFFHAPWQAVNSWKELRKTKTHMRTRERDMDTGKSDTHLFCNSSLYCIGLFAASETFFFCTLDSYFLFFFILAFFLGLNCCLLPYKKNRAACSTLDTPVLLRSPKLSNVGLGQYLDGWPPRYMVELAASGGVFLWGFPVSPLWVGGKC